jgi:hypothetical protein
MKHYPRFPSLRAHAGLSVSANALLDTKFYGQSITLRHRALGCNLGGTNCLLAIGGKSARVEARGLFVYVQIGNLEPVRLAFAWAKTSQIPLILGQTNFFENLMSVFNSDWQCTIGTYPLLIRVDVFWVDNRFWLVLMEKSNAGFLAVNPAYKGTDDRS